MNPFTFQVPSNILFENGASKKVADLAAAFGAQRILLGDRQGRARRRPDPGCRGRSQGRPASTVVVFEDVVADPPSEVIERAVALCRDERIDLVLSIGGGSALDTAKLVAYLAEVRRPPRRHLRRRPRQGAAPAAAARAHHGRHGLRGHADRHRDDADDREEGRRLASAAARLGHSRSRTDAGPAVSCHGGHGHRRHGACDRGLYEPAQEEPDVGPIGPAGAGAAVRRTSARSAATAGTSRRARRCCSDRCWPAWPSPTRRWRPCMRSPIRSGRSSMCLMGCRTPWC